MLHRFFAYYRPYRTLLLIDFGAAVLLGLLELAFPTAVQAFIDRLLPSSDWPLILLAAGGPTDRLFVQHRADGRGELFRPCAWHRHRDRPQAHRLRPSHQAQLPLLR